MMDILYIIATLIACVFAFFLGYVSRYPEPSQTYLNSRNWNASVSFDRSMSRAERLDFLDRVRAWVLTHDDSKGGGRVSEK